MSNLYLGMCLSDYIWFSDALAVATSWMTVIELIGLLSII